MESPIKWASSPTPSVSTSSSEPLSLLHVSQYSISQPTPAQRGVGSSVAPHLTHSREHLGLLPAQQVGGVQSPSPDISVEDPACEQFYLNTWMKSAHTNTELYEKVLYYIYYTTSILFVRCFMLLVAVTHCSILYLTGSFSLMQFSHRISLPTLL